jgi:hypothetical protein
MTITQRTRDSERRNDVATRAAAGNQYTQAIRRTSVAICHPERTETLNRYLPS